MKRFVLIMLAVVASAVCTTAQLKNAENNAVLAKIKSANEKVSSMSCKFDRTIKQAMLDKAANSNGDFYYTRANKLCMKYTSGEIVTINNEDVLIGKEGKKRVLKASSKHAEPLVNTLIGCVSGDLSKLNGKLENVKESADGVTVTISVDDFKVGQSRFTKVLLQYGKDLTIQSIKLLEADGSYTLYSLQKKTLNKSVDELVYKIEKKTK